MGQLEDSEEAEHGFYIVKNNAILDTETTLIDQVSVLKPYVWDNGKYRCNLIESIDEYAAKGAAPPTPLTNRVDFRTEANAFGTCSSCPTCDNKMAHLEKAWGLHRRRRCRRPRADHAAAQGRGALCGREGVRVVRQRGGPDPRRLLRAHVHVQVAAPGPV